ARKLSHARSNASSDASLARYCGGRGPQRALSHLFAEGTCSRRRTVRLANVERPCLASPSLELMASAGRIVARVPAISANPPSLQVLMGSGEVNAARSGGVMKRISGLACLALLTFVLVAAPAMAQTLDKVKVVIPENSVFVLNWMGARDAGIFRRHGIDLEVDTRPFAGFLAALPAKQCMVATYSGIDAVLKMNQGFDLAVIGGGLTVIQDIFVPKESPIKSVGDLRGKRLG